MVLVKNHRHQQQVPFLHFYTSEYITCDCHVTHLKVFFFIPQKDAGSPWR